LRGGQRTVGLVEQEDEVLRLGLDAEAGHVNGLMGSATTSRHPRRSRGRN
jgi:hypothetical protein